MNLRINSCDGIYCDSLDVRFTKSCDNNCSFCIERNGLDSLGHTDVNTMIQNTKDSGKDTVLILGGEPFLFPEKLLKYVEGIRGFTNSIYITTSLPSTIDLANLDVVEILNLIDGLNVSLQHYDWRINNEVLRASSNHNRIDLLSKLLESEDFASKIRVSINLTTGYIDSGEKLMAFLDLLKSINCKHVKINELQNVNKDIYVSFEDIMGVKMKSPYSFGCQADISNFFKEHDMKVTLKRSCFVVKDKAIAKASVFDLGKSVLTSFRKLDGGMTVMYENGDVCGGWLSKK